MATKKKKTPARKSAPARRRPTKKSSAPSFAPATAPVPETSPSQNGGLYLLIAIALLVLGWLVWHSRQAKAPDTAAPVAVATAPAASAAGTPPQARSIVDPAKAPKAADAVKPTTASARREPAGGAPKQGAEPAEKGAPSLTFDRSLGQALGVRSWRNEGGIATLEVFAPKNRLVRSIKSEVGKAGLVDLKWDGKDELGQKVPVGLYFLRPSQKEAQSIRDVWVKG